MAQGTFALVLMICRAVSWPAAAVHALLARLHLVVLPPAVTLSPVPRWQVLADCWFAKALREALPLLLRTPLRNAAMACVVLDRTRIAPGGAVLATIHSSWTRFLSQWCRDHDVLVLVRRGRSVDLGQAAVGSRFADLRRIVSRLRQGGLVFVAPDAFVDHGVPVTFLGHPREASPVPARLARIAGVPLIAAVPAWRHGRIELVLGPAMRARTRSDEGAATRAVIGELETLILDRPGGWNDTLRGAVGWWHSSEFRDGDASLVPGCAKIAHR